MADFIKEMLKPAELSPAIGRSAMMFRFRDRLPTRSGWGPCVGYVPTRFRHTSRPTHEHRTLIMDATKKSEQIDQPRRDFVRAAAMTIAAAQKKGKKTYTDSRPPVVAAENFRAS